MQYEFVNVHVAVDVPLTIEMGALRVQFTPPSRGSNPRRVEHIVFDSWTFSTEFGWSELEKQAGNLSALQTVLLIAASRDCLSKYCDNIPPLIPRLFQKLKLAFKSKGSHQKPKDNDEYVQISLADNGVQSIGVCIVTLSAYSKADLSVQESLLQDGMHGGSS